MVRFWSRKPSSTLVGICSLVVILVNGESLTLAADPPAQPPPTQEDKNKSTDAGKIQERSVKRPAPRPGPKVSPPSPPVGPVPVPYPN